MGNGLRIGLRLCEGHEGIVVRVIGQGDVVQTAEKFGEAGVIIEPAGPAHTG